MNRFLQIGLKIIQDQFQWAHILCQADQHQHDAAENQHKAGPPKYGETKRIPSFVNFRNDQTEEAELKTEKQDLRESHQLWRPQ